MAIRFVPTSRNMVVVTSETDALLKELLEYTVNGLHRIEKQLEKITDETIDEDEENLL